jgi:hypothetical protein
MAALLPDSLRDLVEPFLPVPPPRPNGGRPRVPAQACLTGILLCSEAEFLADVAAGAGLRLRDDLWRRLHDRQDAGIWHLMDFVLLDWLARDDQIDWPWAVDSCSVRAVCGGTKTGPNPTDRAKRGSNCI